MKKILLKILEGTVLAGMVVFLGFMFLCKQPKDRSNNKQIYQLNKK